MSLRQNLAARARGVCECGCNRALGDYGELDHFFGRAKADETEFLCWLLHRECHHRKTVNSPTALVWIARFISHLRKYAVGENGYVLAILEAEKKAAWLTARKGTG